MQVTQDRAKAIRALIPPAAIVIAMEAYYIGQSPPEERLRRIVRAAVTVLAFATVAVLSIRKRTLSPANPRLSPSTAAAIAVVLIIIAVLSRHL
jgi:hypothetical protein